MDSSRLAMFEAINSRKREDSLALAKLIEEREKKMNDKAKADSAKNAMIQEILREMYQIRVEKIEQSSLSAADYEFHFKFEEKLYVVLQKALKNNVKQKYTFSVVPFYKGDAVKSDAPPACTKDAKIDIDTYKCIVPMKKGNRDIEQIIVYHLDNNGGEKAVIGSWKR